MAVASPNLFRDVILKNLRPPLHHHRCRQRGGRPRDRTTCSGLSLTIVEAWYATLHLDPDEAFTLFNEKKISSPAAAARRKAGSCELLGALSLAFPSNPFAGKRYFPA